MIILSEMIILTTMLYKMVQGWGRKTNKVIEIKNFKNKKKGKK